MIILKELFKKYGIDADSKQLDDFDKFYNIVVQENKKFNLTAIVDEDEFAVKHILDSLLCAHLIPNGSSVIDVGAGAGFPSIPLKILRPDLKITMIDSLNKRVNFLNDTVQKLGLAGIEAIHTRAEDYAIKAREKYDVGIARAVASMNTLSEYLLPLVGVGGLFIAMKGSKFEEELDGAQEDIKLLGGEVLALDKNEL